MNEIQNRKHEICIIQNTGNINKISTQNKLLYISRF